MTGLGLALRPARAEDAEFVVNLTEACMRHYAELTWGHWSEEMTRKSFRWETHRVVMLGAADIGCVELAEEPGLHRLHKLYIHPDYQNRGLGTALLEAMIAQAGKQGAELTLSVLRANPAIRLYRRMGFLVTEENAERFFLTWRPGAVTDP